MKHSPNQNQNQNQSSIFPIQGNNSNSNSRSNSRSRRRRKNIKPLTSITVTVNLPQITNDDSNILGNDDKNNPTRDLLFHSFLKREMIGKIIHVMDDDDDDGDDERSSNCLSSSVIKLCDIPESLLFQIRGRNSSGTGKCMDAIELKVISVLPSIISLKDDVFCGGGMIVPSTRITLIKESVGVPMNDCRLSLDQHSNERKVFDLNSKANDQLSFAGKVIKDSLIALAKASFITKTNNGVCNSTNLKLNIPRSFVLTGPPGVGKTYSIRQIVKFFDDSPISLSMKSIRGSELLGLGYGNTERELRRIFQQLADECGSVAYAERIGLIFLDEGEALLGNARTAAQIGVLLDRMSTTPFKESGTTEMFPSEVSNSSSRGWERLVFVVATNNLNMIPSILRRPGRLEREITVDPPDSKKRVAILKTLLCCNFGSNAKFNHEISREGNNLEHSIDMSDDELDQFAEECVGYVAADLNALVRKSFLSSLEGLRGRNSLTIGHLKDAKEKVGASVLRDAALNAPPKTRWDDVAGDVGGAKKALRQAVEWPRLKKNVFSRMKIVPPRGILLHGPPGTAKTTLAKAAAGSCGIAFFSLSPADVFASSYVGEAESVIRRAFSIARSASPCLLFFDEIDAILGGDDANGVKGRQLSSAAESRVLSTFLNEMDGVDTTVSDGVLVLGATNRPSTLDAALLRPGRFDKIIYVPPPDESARRSIMLLQCKKLGLNESDMKNIDINRLATEEISGLMTGAEIEGACHEAAIDAMKEYLESPKEILGAVRHEHLENAIKNVQPLLSDSKLLSQYSGFG